LSSQTGTPTGLKNKNWKFWRRRGVNDVRRTWRAEHFGIFTARGGEDKVFMPSMVGYGYFLESSNPACHMRPVSLKFMNL